MEQGGGVFNTKDALYRSVTSCLPLWSLDTHLQPLLCTQSSSHCLETGGSEALTRNPKQLNTTIYLLKQN